jgi:hypothetical protein
MRHRRLGCLLWYWPYWLFGGPSQSWDSPYLRFPIPTPNAFPNPEIARAGRKALTAVAQVARFT